MTLPQWATDFRNAMGDEDFRNNVWLKQLSNSIQDESNETNRYGHPGALKVALDRLSNALIVNLSIVVARLFSSPAESEPGAHSVYSQQINTAYAAQNVWACEHGYHPEKTVEHPISGKIITCAPFLLRDFTTVVEMES